jgi:hypothetical protein
MEHSTRTRRLISTVLAVFLAVESVSAVAAAAVTTPVPHRTPDAAPAAASAPTIAQASVPSWTPANLEPFTGAVIASVAIGPERAAVPSRAPKADTGTKSRAKATVKAAKPARTTTKAASKPRVTHYAGTNHVWIPSLGISKSVRAFSCSRTRPPDNYMYRWGCAGANNVYLMGHAYGVMKPLHDAYVNGRLHVGMKAYYAAGNGKVHVYTVRWWRLTKPTTDAAWAWAAQSVPSMTLQTCVGSNSQYRLMVRLVEVKG